MLFVIEMFWAVCSAHGNLPYLPTSYTETVDSHVGVTAKLLKAQRASRRLGILQTWSVSRSEVVSESMFLRRCCNDTSNGVGAADLGTTL